MRNSVLRHCPGCATEREFETPACAEHGADCPELACVICGWALIGPFEVSVAAPAVAADATPVRRAG